MTVNNWPERKWTLGLRRRPASDADGDRGYDGAVEYELICRYCGDDPLLRYGEVPAELQQIRGPYSPGKGTCSGGSRRNPRAGSRPPVARSWT